MSCFRDDFEACIAHLRLPVRHRKAIRTTNLLERLFGEERRRMKVILNAWGERPVLKLMFAAMTRASQKWRPIGITGFERRQMTAVRKELDEEYEKANGPVQGLKTEHAPQEYSAHLGLDPRLQLLQHPQTGRHPVAAAGDPPTQMLADRLHQLVAAERRAHRHGLLNVGDLVPRQTAPEEGGRFEALDTRVHAVGSSGTDEVESGMPAAATSVNLFLSFSVKNMKHAANQQLVHVRNIDPKNRRITKCHWAAPGQSLEDAVVADPDVVADRQLGAVGDEDSGLLPPEAVQEHAARHEQARDQGDEAATCRQLAEAAPMLLPDPVDPEMLEVPER